MAPVLPLAAVFLPVATLLVAIVAILAISISHPALGSRWARHISAASLGASLGELSYLRFHPLPIENSLYVWQMLPQTSIQIPVAFRLDGLSFLFSLIVLFVTLVVTILAGYIEPQARESRRFYVISLCLALASLNLYQAENLVWLYVSWTFVGLCAYLLVGQQVEETETGQWAKKLFVISLSASFILFASLLSLAVRGGTLDILTFSMGSDSPGVLLPVVLAAATASCLYPFNVWIGSAARVALPTSILLHAGSLVPSGIYLLVRFRDSVDDTSLNPLWNRSLAFLGIAAIVMGTYYVLRERNARMVMANDTTIQMGVALLGIAVGTPLALAAVLLHLIGFALFKTGQMVYTGNCQIGETGKFSLLQVRGTKQRNILCLLLACNAGVPFFVGFFARWMLANALVDAGYTFLALIIIGANAVSFAYAFLVPHLLTTLSNDETPSEVSACISGVTAVLAGLSMLFGIMPFLPLNLLVIPAFPADLATALDADMKTIIGLSPNSDLAIALWTLGLLLISMIIGLIILAFMLSDDLLDEQSMQTNEGNEQSEFAHPDSARISASVRGMLSLERTYSVTWGTVSNISALCRSVVAPFERSHYVATILLVVLGMALILLD